jgi:imidazole glycerol-phosphate synthase subunit HisF
MLRVRIIPCLLLRRESLVKTVKFGKYAYIGDPLNTCRIFNELEVDELAFLDIMASAEKRSPNFKILQEISNECFMPLSYGGGICDVATAEKVFALGFEKVVLNSAPIWNHRLIDELSRTFGSQSVVASIDVRKSLFGGYHVCSVSGTIRHKLKLVEWAKEIQSRGAGEILLTSIDREGTWEGFDLKLVRMVADAVSIPVIAHGGAGKFEDIQAVVQEGHASAVALGSMVVFQKKGMGVLVNVPDRACANNRRY